MGGRLAAPRPFPMTSPLLDALRAATRDSHRQLEDGLQIEARLADRKRYRALLAGFLGMHEPLEARLAQCRDLGHLGYHMAERTKIPALRRDLAALGMSETEINALPRFQASAFPNAGAALGTAYVLEGSTLGGQSITRLIADGGHDVPAEFFNVYGAQTHTQWLDFLKCLGSYERTGGKPDAVTTAARGTFQAFAQWLI